MIVEDMAENLEPGQMRKSEFLAQLRASVCNTTAEALADTPWSEAGCPYIDRWFGHYSAQSSQYVERAILRYAPEAASATAASGYIPAITSRVSRSVATWATTGEITGAPEGASLGLPGEDITGAAGGAPSQIDGATSGLVPDAGRTMSGIGNVLFKEREGGAREVDDPQAIQSQLGAGQSLDGGVKSQMESSFGESFSGVQVHTDANAAGLSDSLNARAFTVGEHVAFGAGEYQPGTLIGDTLIAHELAHVMQQRGGGASVESKQDGGSGYSALEEDADQAAVGAVVSIWGRTKSNLARISRNAMPQLKTGLRLQGCSTKSKGPMGETRLGEARSNFVSNNKHLTPGERQKIDEALKAVTGDNLNLWITFYDYYSNHEISKMGTKEAEVAATKSLYAETKPNSDTVVRPDILDAGFSTAKLGTILIHEFTHTRHNQNVMGFGDYQEGDSYGIEHFLAQRVGNSERVKEIETVMNNPTKIVMAQGVAALNTNFRTSHATMQGLYEVIDSGKSTHSGSPLTTLTADEARSLVAELVSVNENDRSTRLKDIMTWVKAHLAEFKLPI
ncbi:MAG: DUF4157 domain-containing protein [Acidobacteria bacterium]|nr:DUF4157 domain-containing protein [Acidobacteriota bacterium]